MKIPRLLPTVRIRREKFGAILFDKEGERFFVVDEIGSEVLSAIESGKTLEELVQELGQRYEAPPEVIKQDVLSFIDELCKAGLAW